MLANALLMGGDTGADPAYPVSDVTVGNWGSPLWSQIDDEDDASFTSCAYSESGELGEVKLAQTRRTCRTVTVRMRYLGTAASSFPVSLFCGGTSIKQFFPTLTTSFAAYTMTLSDAEAAGIADWADLRIRLEVSADVGQTGTARCSSAKMSA